MTEFKGDPHLDVTENKERFAKKARVGDTLRINKEYRYKRIDARKRGFPGKRWEIVQYPRSEPRTFDACVKKWEKVIEEYTAIVERLEHEATKGGSGNPEDHKRGLEIITQITLLSDIAFHFLFKKRRALKHEENEEDIGALEKSVSTTEKANDLMIKSAQVLMRGIQTRSSAEATHRLYR